MSGCAFCGWRDSVFWLKVIKWSSPSVLHNLFTSNLRQASASKVLKIFPDIRPKIVLNNMLLGAFAKITGKTSKPDNFLATAVIISEPQVSSQPNSCFTFLNPERKLLINWFLVKNSVRCFLVVVSVCCPFPCQYGYMLVCLCGFLAVGCLVIGKR